MTYNPNKYYQAYLCAYNKIKYTVESSEKNFSKVINCNFLLLIPFVFTFVLGIVFVPSNDSTKINLLYSQKIIDDDFFTNPRMLNNIDKKIASKKPETKISVSEIIISDARIRVDKISNTKKLSSLQVAPLDWKNNLTKKKIKFIETLLPLISYQNQKIIVERARLFEIYDYLDLQKTLPKDDIVLLENMAKKYLINSKNKHKIDLVKELLQSVDIIPNSIVLAQAANESGWGSSRFAKEHNALFGQYTYDEKYGVVPLNRDEGEHYLIRYFSSIDKSIESYFKNINTHYAYEKFRQIRSEMNKNNLGLNVKLLTQHLDAYAKDEFYVETINSIIETNNFIQFDLTNQYFVNSL